MGESWNLKNCSLNSQLNYMSNQQQKSETNCPMNVIFYAQIAFKKRIFPARPAKAYVES